MYAPLGINPTPEMEGVVLQIEHAAQKVWRRNPDAGLNVDDLREQVAELEVLLPQIAEHADTFYYSNFDSVDYFRELYEGFALDSLMLMIDMRALYVAADIAAFVTHLEAVSQDAYQLRKYVGSHDSGKNRWSRGQHLED